MCYNGPSHGRPERRPAASAASPARAPARRRARLPRRGASRAEGPQKLIRIDLTFDQKLDIVGVLLAVAGGLILLTLLPGSAAR
jgi:hypothetical protein